jgi:hypothetical protein
MALATLLACAASWASASSASASGTATVAASSASPFTWSAGVTPLRAETGLTLNDVSCPGTELCVAVNLSQDGGGDMFTSTDPTAGAGSWKELTLDLGAASSGSAGFSALVCVSTSLCLASDGNGDIWVSTDPSAGASAWSREHLVDPSNLNDGIIGLACPSATLCVANDASGDVWVSTDPASGASSWQQSATMKGSSGQIEGFGPVHCNSATFCWSTITQGTLYGKASQTPITNQTWSTSTPLSGGWAVTTSAVPAVVPVNVSCASTSLCVQVSGGAIATAPSSSGPWQTSPLIGWTPPATGVSCPVRFGCIAVDQGGNVLQIASHSGTGTGTGQSVTWTATALPGQSFTGGVSCPTSSFCLAGEPGGVGFSSDPTGPAADWQSINLPAARGAQINAVSCPSPHLCIAATSHGSVLASSTPTAAASWRALRTLPKVGDSGNALIPQPLTFTSCPSSHLCFAGAAANVDGEDDDSADSGMLLISTNPTKPGSWSGYRIGLAGISCPAVNLCMGLQETSWSSQAAAVVYSSDPKRGFATWKALGRKPVQHFEADSGNHPKRSTAAPKLKGLLINNEIQPRASGMGGSSIACEGRRLCVAVGESGSADKPRSGVVAVSTDPSAASSWHVKKLSNSPLVGVSCSESGQCVAYSASGQLFLTDT